MSQNSPTRPDLTKGDKTYVRARKALYKRVLSPLSYSKLAKELGLNVSHLYYFIIEGREPKQDKDRAVLGLHKKVCSTCGRKVSPTKRNRKEVTEWQKEWRLLSVEEREKVIQQYLKYKKEKNNG